ncbi:MAG TPA: hypothetical protein VIP46_12470 [Pyrinomonadaceae bacterium]
MLTLCFLVLSFVAAPGQGQSVAVLPASTPQPATEAAAAGELESADPPPAAQSPTPPLTKSDAPAALEPPGPDKRNDPPPDSGGDPAAPEGGDAAPERDKPRRGFGWEPAAAEAMLFLGVQHGYALTQPKTQRALSGPFFRDYFRSVASLGKWDDGGRFFTNYVAHPMQGSLLGFIWVQNDPKGKRARFGRSKAYWRSRAKAVAWSAAWSTQFEIGPVSQASIGNVGLHGKQTWVDVVITPAGGAVWLVAEDALDRFVVRRIERMTDNRLVRIAARMLFTPTRSSANLLRFRKPWHRDR